MSAATKSEAARLEGNDAMRRKDYTAAFNCYTVALQSMPRDHLVLANRSQAALKLRHFALALRDAESAISHGPAAWHKGHYRKAMAEFETQNFAEAALSFSAAAKRAPDEAILKDALAYVSLAQDGADRQQASERYSPLVGAVLGVMIGLLLLSVDLYSGNVARGTRKGSLSAVDGTTASTAMGLFMSAAGGALGYASGYGWNLWNSTKRFEQLHKVTAVVDEPAASSQSDRKVPPRESSDGDRGGDEAAAAGAASDGAAKREGKPKVRRRTSAREAALKAAAAGKK